MVGFDGQRILATMTADYVVVAISRESAAERGTCKEDVAGYGFNVEDLMRGLLGATSFLM